MNELQNSALLYLLVNSIPRNEDLSKIRKELIDKFEEETNKKSDTEQRIKKSLTPKEDKSNE